MADIRISIDRSMLRAGLDANAIAEDGIDVQYSEHLAALETFYVIVAFLGVKALDHVSSGAVERSMGRLLDFARSREARLRVEFELRKVDRRVQTVAQLDCMDREEFKRALDAVPLIEARVRHIAGSTSEYITEMYFVWDDPAWQPTYYRTEGGESVTVE